MSIADGPRLDQWKMYSSEFYFSTLHTIVRMLVVKSTVFEYHISLTNLSDGKLNKMYKICSAKMGCHVKCQHHSWKTIFMIIICIIVGIIINFTI